MPRLEDHWYDLGTGLKNLQPTEKIGVEVWPNVSTTRDDLVLVRLLMAGEGRGRNGKDG